jgi:hypothetical protein
VVWSQRCVVGRGQHQQIWYTTSMSSGRWFARLKSSRYGVETRRGNVEVDSRVSGVKATKSRPKESGALRVCSSISRYQVNTLGALTASLRARRLQSTPCTVIALARSSLAFTRTPLALLHTPGIITKALPLSRLYQRPHTDVLYCAIHALSIQPISRIAGYQASAVDGWR